MTEEFSPEVQERIVAHAMRDLDPSWLVLHRKVGIAAIFGGILSLGICGQFGLGFTSIATSFNHALHNNMGPHVCAIICGVLYAIFPIAVLRFLICNPLQFKTITKNHGEVIVLWFGGFGGIVAYFGHHGNDALAFTAWIAAALAAASLLSRALYFMVPGWDSHIRIRLMDQN
jgi:hypothetical protein